MGLSILSPVFLSDYWLDDDFPDDWIAPQAPDIVWDDDLSDINEWIDDDWSDEDWITEHYD